MSASGTPDERAGLPDGPATPPADRPLSRRERLILRLEREADLRLGPFGVWVFRRTNGRVARLWKVDALILTTRGRRTGRERTLVLRYFPDGDAMIVAAANDGGPSHPGWYHNLSADPVARVEVNGRAFRVRAEELPPDQAAVAWRHVVEVQPSYERFRRATDRTFPILRLVPIGEG